MYLLLARPFKPVFLEKIQQLAPNLTIVFEDDLHDTQWQEVVVTIGFKASWKDRLLAPNSQLKWVQSISAGVDTLPLAEFQARGILVSNGSGIHSESITDHVIGVLYMYTRQLFRAQQAQLTHQWADLDGGFKQLSELTVTIVGTGQIGTFLARRLQALGVTVLGINRTGHDQEPFTQTAALSKLHEITKTSDIVINILPLTSATTALYDHHFFAQFKPDAAFINVGRGESVVETDLIAALKQKQLAFAALDVTKTEPLPSDSPLWSVDNLLITPHISGYTPHFETKFMAIFLANLEQFIANQTLVKNQVNLQEGY